MLRGNDPFPLSAAESSALSKAIGDDAFNEMPSWGSIATWNNRTILIFPRTNGTFAFTDISGGIPKASAPGGYIPADVLTMNTPRTQTASWLVGLYSIPANFLDVALERYKQLVAAGKYIAQTTGEIAGAAISPITDSLGNTLFPLAIIGVVVLVFMYGKKG